MSDEEVKRLGFDPRKVVFVLAGSTLYARTGDDLWTAYPPYPVG